MRNRKKILYIVTKSSFGGAQRYVFDLTTNLSQDLFDIAVASGGDGPLFEMLSSQGIRTIAIKNFTRDIHPVKELLAFFELVRLISREKPDIIHLNSSKAGGIGAIAAKTASVITRHPILVIFTVHGWGFNEPRPFLQKKLMRAASWFAGLFQDTVIAINSSDHELARQIISQQKLVLIRNGIIPPSFLPRKKIREFLSAHSRTAISQKDFVFGTVAEFTKNKGLPYLIAAAHALIEKNKSMKIKFFLIGGGEDELTLRYDIKKRGLDGHVFLMGYIPDARRYLSGFDAFVLPSLKEGVPYTIMEAMSAGLPIIATKTGGVPELLGDAGILVNAANPADLAHALTHVHEKPAIRQNLSKKALRRAHDSFAFPAMIRNTQRIYESS